MPTDAKTDRLGDMRQAHVGAAVEVGNGARHTQHPVIAARGQAETVRHAGQQRAPFGIRGGDLIEQRPFGIGIHPQAGMGGIARACRARAVATRAATCAERCRPRPADRGRTRRPAAPRAAGRSGPSTGPKSDRDSRRRSPAPGCRRGRVRQDSRSDRGWRRRPAGNGRDSACVHWPARPPLRRFRSAGAGSPARCGEIRGTRPETARHCARG